MFFSLYIEHERNVSVDYDHQHEMKRAKLLIDYLLFPSCTTVLISSTNSSTLEYRNQLFLCGVKGFFLMPLDMTSTKSSYSIESISSHVDEVYGYCHV